MYRSEVVRWQFGGQKGQLFSTAVLMESPRPRTSFNVGLTTFHIFLPKQVMLQQYLSCV